LLDIFRYSKFLSALAEKSRILLLLRLSSSREFKPAIKVTSSISLKAKLSLISFVDLAKIVLEIFLIELLSAIKVSS
jgi:hypothetical protein